MKSNSSFANEIKLMNKMNLSTDISEIQPLQQKNEFRTLTYHEML